MYSKAKNLSLAKQLVLGAAVLFSNFSLAQTREVNVTIDASKTGPPISKYIYRQFLEHIGGVVNNNIWAEMLDDRKFYDYFAPARRAARPELEAHRTAPLDADWRRRIRHHGSGITPTWATTRRW